MQDKLFLPVFVAGMLAAAAATAAAQTTNFASTYNGASTAGGTCSMSYSIAGVEPSGTGPYPVFIYMVGTSESYNNAAAMAAVTARVSWSAASARARSSRCWPRTSMRACRRLTASA